MPKTIRNLLFLLLVFPLTIHGELFYYPALSASALGTAYAGAASGTEDITQQFYNPAVLPYFHETAFGVVGSALFPRDQLVDGVAKTSANTELATDGAIKDFAPHIAGGGFYGLIPMPRNLYLGIAVTTPWRRKETYAADWFGRYYGTRLEIMSTNITPSLGFSIRDILAFAVGAQIDFFHIKYEEAVDFGSIADDLSIDGSSPGNQDGFLKINANDWSYGYVVGGIMKPCDYIRLGVSFRSDVDHQFSFLPAFTLSDIGQRVNDKNGLYKPLCDATMTINCPQIVTAGIHYFHDCQCEFMGTIVWKSWSRDNGIRVTYSNTSQPDTVIVQDGWNDTFSVSVGGKYYNPLRTWYLRIGGMYDQNPIPADSIQTPLFYAEETGTIAAGWGWNFCQFAYFDVAWCHVFSKDPIINQAITDDGNMFRGTLSGKIQTISDTLCFSFVGFF